VLHAGDGQTLGAAFTPADNVDYTTATATTTISVLRATPAVTWASPAPITFGTPLGPTELDATASVPGSFAYTPAAGTLLNAGNNQTLSVSFTPSDIADYTTASAATTLNVNQATPVLTWSSPTPITYGTPLGPDQLDATASVPGAFTYSPAAGAVLHAGGSQMLSVTFTPTDALDYTAATTKATISVSQATPPVVWLSPAPIAVGTALGAIQLDARASVPGSFVYSPAAGTVLSLGNNERLSTTFTPADSVDYVSVTVSTKITVVPATVAVALASSSADPSVAGQSVTFDGAVAEIGCSPSAITGAMVFYDGKPGAGGIRIGQPQVVSGGHARLATSTLSSGMHAIYAVFAPAPSTGAVYTSAPLSQKVNGAGARLAVLLVPPSGSGTPNFTVLARVTTTVPGFVPTGTISFRVGQGRTQKRALVNGVAILERTRSRPVNETFFVTFRGDRRVLAASSAQVEFSV
jgi:hypothetical protein